MKALIATAVVALGLLSAVTTAQAASDDYPGYPEWARHAFEYQG